MSDLTERLLRCQKECVVVYGIDCLGQASQKIVA